MEKLYQQIFTAADPVAKANVMTEYICFLTDMANYEAMLKALHMMCEEQGNKEDAQELSGILEELGIQ